MAKTLKLGFVMGGGVSLGSFSGAALAESIKQLIVYGQYATDEKDANGNPILRPYERVVIDVFSGASAGAIALGIMLRVLVNPRDKFSILGYHDYDSFRKALIQKLKQQFGETLDHLEENYPDKFEDLIAAQTVQEIQEKIWVKEVNIDQLLGTGLHQKDLSSAGGIVDRSVVDNLAKDYFQFQSFSNRTDHRRLLAERVLFGCTLANLNYTIQHQYHKDNHLEEQSPIFKALNDSSVERVHSELRVFDIHLDKTIDTQKPQNLPLKWVQYHNEADTVVFPEDEQGNTYVKSIKSIQHNDTWREIAATTIASAAFPLAFEPVVLNRYRYEFAERWAKELGEVEKFPFTYVDGGMFNNEPIREAMRLASYMDLSEQDKDFDRRVIFVDPNVTELEPQFRVNVHNKIAVSRSVLTGQAKISEKSTLHRIVSKIPYLLSALLNEAQSVEVEKISKVLDKFKQREQMRQLYRKTLQTSISIDNQEVTSLRNSIITALDKLRQKLDLPHNVLQIQQEILRTLEEEADYVRAFLPQDRIELIMAMQKIVYSPVPAEEVEHIQYWYHLLTCIALDLSMDLIGKTAQTQLIPIAPFDFYTDSKDGLRLLNLPGGGLAGFAGFASYEASHYEVQYGAYCTYRILSDLGYLSDGYNNTVCPAPFDDQHFNDSMKMELQKVLLKRAKEMLSLSDGIAALLPFVKTYLSDVIHDFVDKNLNKTATTHSYQFHLLLPEDRFVLKGENRKASLEAVKYGGDDMLMVNAIYYPKTSTWSGLQVHDNQLIVQKMGLFGDEDILSIQLPNIPVDHPARFAPNPIFKVDLNSYLRIAGYSEVDAKEWVYQTAMETLDESLWGGDKWQNMMNKI